MQGVFGPLPCTRTIDARIEGAFQVGAPKPVAEWDAKRPEWKESISFVGPLRALEEDQEPNRHGVWGRALPREVGLDPTSRVGTAE